jgi:flavin-binding protein dodecin
METAWVKDTNVVVRDGKVVEWRVRLKITFLVD